MAKIRGFGVSDTQRGSEKIKNFFSNLLCVCYHNSYRPKNICSLRVYSESDRDYFESVIGVIVYAVLKIFFAYDRSLYLAFF
jgi:hypothetical protein